ncbi:MAG: YcxB family protein [Oscillospiraceae bacterium]|nr:YcxB family protein [Oscillospiraceae bacterium]
MEIKAKCKYDFDSVKALTHLTMYKKADPKKRLIFWSAAFLILSIIIILEIVAFSMDTILLILLGVNILFLFLIFFWYFIIPRIQYKSLAKMQNVENEYMFGDNVLKVFSKSQEYNGEAQIEYSFFVKVYETTKYLFLYKTNNQVFVVDKSTIEGGTVEEIRNKLSAFVKDKYIICKY